MKPCEPLGHSQTLEQVGPSNHVRGAQHGESLGHLQSTEHGGPSDHMQGAQHAEPLGHLQTPEQGGPLRRTRHRAKNTYDSKYQTLILE